MLPLVGLAGALQRNGVLDRAPEMRAKAQLLKEVMLDMFSQISMGATYFQFLAIFGRFNVSWPSVRARIVTPEPYAHAMHMSISQGLTSWFDGFSFANLNLELTSPECSMEITWCAALRHAVRRDPLHTETHVHARTQVPEIHGIADASVDCRAAPVDGASGPYYTTIRACPPIRL